MGKLQGQNALIYGASSGMGYECALLFASEGAKVMAVARRTDRLQILADEAKKRNLSVSVAQCDVSDRGVVDETVACFLKEHGKLDVVVNAAGLNYPERLVDRVTNETWERVLKTNLTGAFNITQSAVIPMKKNGGGVIIHITSVSGKWGDTSGAAYQASKHGMVGLAYATMIEERTNGIRVSLIFPGLADTEIIRNRPVPVKQETLDKAMRAEDIAEGCLFIASLPARTYVPELIMMPGGLQAVGQAII